MKLRKTAARNASRSLAIALAVFLAGLGLGEISTARANQWESRIVTLEITGKSFNYFQPWQRSVGKVVKNGVVLDGRQVLTTADRLQHNTLVRLQKFGRGRWWQGEVEWVDFNANLALIRAKEDAFYDDLLACELASPVANVDDLQLFRWRDGRLEKRRAEFYQFRVHPGELAPVNHLQMHIDSDIDAAGWAEPVISGEEVVGLTSSHRDKRSTVIPSSFIQSILDARQTGEYTGLGYFHFIWQPTENLDTFRHLQVEEPAKGAIVIKVPELPGRKSKLKAKDVILEVEGYPIDIQGDYLDPNYGYLMLENLSTRSRWAGNTVEMKILRDGEPMNVAYVIPPVHETFTLIGNTDHGEEPEYLIAGGLLFQPLTKTMLDAWRRNAPFRLGYYQSQPVTDEHSSLVVLSNILPDPYNLGYEDHRLLVLDKVNERSVSTLAQLEEALKQPENGFHILHFADGTGLQKMVLDADTLSESTDRVLRRYGIPFAHQFTKP